MKKWIVASMAAASLTLGGMTAQADTMVLSGGESLDLGAISVYDGERSFFGSQIHDWLMEDSAAKTVEEALNKEKVFPEGSDASKAASEMAIDILRRGKVYQVRSVDNGTYYQGMVLSISVSDAEMLQMTLLSQALEKKDAGDEAKKLAEGAEAAEAAKEEDELDDLPLLSSFVDDVEVKTHSDWKKAASKAGIAYETGSAQITLKRKGLALPLFLKGIVMRESGSTTYTLLAADQASGTYLEPAIDKALAGAKK